MHYKLASLLLLLPVSAISAEKVDYLRDIKPILTRHCLECQGPKKQEGEFRVDTGKQLLAGGESGEAVVPGKASFSLLIDMVKGLPGVRKMPWKRTPLKKKEIDLLVKWIDQGAKVTKEETVASAHWAFEVPKRWQPATVKQQGWPRNPIDTFVLARLEKEGVKPSPEAAKTVLLRRLYLDLIGLPPTVEEVQAFLADERPDAHERVVDRLLDSPHYGERWGRRWLDIARYADSNGFTIDSPRQIWKYRDWVIDAFNRDLPFDQFVIEQYAGDMLADATIEQKIATGFHRNTLLNQEGGIDREQFRVDAVADRVDTTGVVFLGLTLGCARCHDHKYDPVKQREYYQLFAFLNNQSEPTLSIATPALRDKREAIEKQIADLEIELNDDLEAYVKALPEEKQPKNDISMILRLRPDQRTAAQKRSLAKYFRPKSGALKKKFDQLDELKKQMPNFPTTLVLSEMSRPRTTHVHIKGDFTRKGDVVKPDVPTVLHSLPKKTEANRLDLARWLVAEDNPLVARVTINRIWQRYFGRGIVETENDFGSQGTPPTHPKLLDWLATEFMRSGWSLKAMHRLIVTSATYRQSSDSRPELAQKDPYNKLLARQARIRLEAEIVRDNALSVCGLMATKVGGPSVRPPQPQGIYAFTQVRREWKTDAGADRYRRGLYTFFQRSAPYPSLIVFDAPNANQTCTRRIRSNTPLQALTLLNDMAFLEMARGLARRALEDGPKSHSKRLDYVFQLCLARRPNDRETKLLSDYLNKQIGEFTTAPNEARALLGKGIPASASVPELAEQAAWTALARALLNLDEFITRE